MAFAVFCDKICFTPADLSLYGPQGRDNPRADDVRDRLQIAAFGNNTLHLIILRLLLRGLRSCGDKLGIELRKLLVSERSRDSANHIVFGTEAGHDSFRGLELIGKFDNAIGQPL